MLIASRRKSEPFLPDEPLSRLLTKFEQHDLIERVRSDSDGRQRLLRLTPHGREAFAPLNQRAKEEVAELLRERAPDWQPPGRNRDALQQVHCHQHAVLGHDADDGLLRAAGVRVRRVSGCCGLAGSFGYQRGHEEMSSALAERSLAPAVRASPDALVLADGFSCRLQISLTTGRRSLHLAELLDNAN